MPAKPKTVDEYLAAVPPRERAALERVRKAMLAAAPDATEVISYSMPGVRTTMVLAWYAASPNHLAVYARPQILDAVAGAKPFRATKSALHFTADAPIPIALVKRIVKLQAAAAPAGRWPSKKAVKAASRKVAAKKRPAKKPAAKRSPGKKRATTKARR